MTFNNTPPGLSSVSPLIYNFKIYLSIFNSESGSINSVLQKTSVFGNLLPLFPERHFNSNFSTTVIQ